MSGTLVLQVLAAPNRIIVVIAVEALATMAVYISPVHNSRILPTLTVSIFPTYCEFYTYMYASIP